MSTTSILFMLGILGLVWGGFAACLLLLARDSASRSSPTDEP